MTVINMQTMRYINLLTRVTHVQTSKCFVYNNTIIFAVPKDMIARAVGPMGKNIKSMQDVLGKRVKIVEEAQGEGDASKFLAAIVEPIGFKSIEFTNEGMVITAGPRNKAALIGRDKRRLLELGKIVEDSFGRQLKII